MSNFLFSLQSSVSLNQALLSTEKSMQFTTKETLSSQFQKQDPQIQIKLDQSQTQELQFFNHNTNDQINTKNQSKLSFFLGIDQNQQSSLLYQYQKLENNTKFINQLSISPFFEGIMNNFDVQSYLVKTITHKKSFFFGKTHFQYMKSQQAIKTSLKKTLTKLDINDQLSMFQIVKSLNLLGHEEKLSDAITLLQKTLQALSNKSQETRKECFLRLINLIHHKYLLYAIRMYQLLIVFAHTFDLDFDAMVFLSKILKEKLSQENIYKQLKRYMKHIIYIFQKKISREENLLYLPITYQIVSLISFNKIEIPFFLPTGRPIMLAVESREKFKDIKSRLLSQFGVDKINPSLFRFIRIEKFQENIEEVYINEEFLVWDQMSYIYYLSSEAKKHEHKINIFLILKLAFPLQNIKKDKETIDILYANIYFDYCLEKIELISLQENIQVCALFSYVNKIDQQQRLYPKRLRQAFSDRKILHQQMKNLEDAYKSLNIQALKDKAITICIKNFNSLLKFNIVQHKDYRIFVNHLQIQFISTEGQIVKSIPISSIVSWNINGNICEIYLHPPHKNQIIISKSIHLLRDYLNNFTTILQGNLL